MLFCINLIILKPKQQQKFCKNNRSLSFDFYVEIMSSNEINVYAHYLYVLLVEFSCYKSIRFAFLYFLMVWIMFGSFMYVLYICTYIK